MQPNNMTIDPQTCDATSAARRSEPTSQSAGAATKHGSAISTTSCGTSASISSSQASVASSTPSTVLSALSKPKRASRSPLDLGKLKDLRPYDVLCGRCTSCFNNVGNRRFRLTITMNIPAYLKTKTKPERGVIIQSIVDSIQGAGGRFLRPKGGELIPLKDSKIREKVGHALRDLAVMTTTRDDKKPVVTAQNTRQPESRSKKSPTKSHFAASSEVSALKTGKCGNSNISSISSDKITSSAMTADDFEPIAIGSADFMFNMEPIEPLSISSQQQQHDDALPPGFYDTISTALHSSPDQQHATPQNSHQPPKKQRRTTRTIGGPPPMSRHLMETNSAASTMHSASGKMEDSNFSMMIDDLIGFCSSDESASMEPLPMTFIAEKA